MSICRDMKATTPYIVVVFIFVVVARAVAVFVVIVVYVLVGVATIIAWLAFPEALLMVFLVNATLRIKRIIE